MLLAVDTSTSYAGLALYDGQVRTELVWWAGRNHARQLMPAIKHALDQLGSGPRNLRAVAAARGPGSFTGLRVGLGVARGLAFALGIPLYGVGSLKVLAAGLAASPWPVRAVLDAGRGRFATALYRRDGGDWVLSDDIVGVDAEGLLGLVKERCAVVGDLSAVAPEQLSQLGERAWIASPALSVRRPAVLAELAWRSWTGGRSPSAEEGEPFYLTRA